MPTTILMHYLALCPPAVSGSTVDESGGGGGNISGFAIGKLVSMALSFVQILALAI